MDAYVRLVAAGLSCLCLLDCHVLGVSVAESGCVPNDVDAVGNVHHPPIELRTDVSNSVSMLQIDLVDKSSARPVLLVNSTSLAPHGAERAQALKPVAYMHVAKGGSSFMNTLFHNPTLCPGTPEDAWAGPYQFLNGHLFPTDIVCPGSWSLTYPFSKSIGHDSIDAAYEDNAGHFVTMMRQPEQRIISMFYYKQKRDRTNPLPWMQGYDNVSHSLPKFAEAVQGCVVKQMTSSEYFPCFDEMSPPPNQRGVTLAVERLRHGFAFVGLTEEWDLSICLFHAKFGGPCLSREFENTRPGQNHSDELYNTSGLDGFIDVYDGPLYKEAVQIFESDLKAYGTTRLTCEALCSPWS